jgi:hypothetical protein
LSHPDFFSFLLWQSIKNLPVKATPNNFSKYRQTHCGLYAAIVCALSTPIQKPCPFIEGTAFEERLEEYPKLKGIQN